MKIDGSYQVVDSRLQVQKDQTSQNEKRDEVQETREVQDRLEFSTSVREFTRLEKGARETPQVRAERVAEVKAQVEAGTYNIKAEKVAESIITGALIDRRA